MKRYIYICSPYRGTPEEQRAHEKAALRYCRAVRDEYPVDTVIPVAPHLYFTRFLDESDPEQRALGLECGREWLRDIARKASLGVTAELWIFGDRVTEGMEAEIDLALELGLELRQLPADYGLGKKRTKKPDDPRFAEFWEAYPRKVDKPDARRAWANIAPDASTFDRIMAGMAAWKRAGSWNKDGGAYIPHPATWLNKHRWEAEPDRPAQGKGADGRFSYFMNYDQRRYTDEELVAMGLPMPGKI